MFTSRSAPRVRGVGGAARSAAMRIGADIGDATFAFGVSLFNARHNPRPRPMITRLDHTLPNAAGLVAVARGVPSARVGSGKETCYPAAGAWRDARMQFTQNPRDVESRYN